MQLKDKLMSKQYWKHFAAAIAALSAAATLLTVLFNFEWLKNCWLFGAIGTAFVLVGSHFYAKWQVRTKKQIDLTLSNEQKLTICEGNLFVQKGIICIPFNEYFDTHVGDGVVRKDSIHGQFINNCYENRVEELDDLIRKALSPFEYKENKRRLNDCPTRKYPLGTCVDIIDKENTYVLFALTHFDDNDKANLKRVEYTEVTHKLMDHLAEIAENRPVFMPLYGTGLSRLQRTPQRILIHLLDTIDFCDKWSIPGGINIFIKSLDSIAVDLNTVESVVKKGITEKEEE